MDFNSLPYYSQGPQPHGLGDLGSWFSRTFKSVSKALTPKAVRRKLKQRRAHAEATGKGILRKRNRAIYKANLAQSKLDQVGPMHPQSVALMNTRDQAVREAQQAEIEQVKIARDLEQINAEDEQAMIEERNQIQGIGGWI